jgi:hypothetical protein
LRWGQGRGEWEAQGAGTSESPGRMGRTRRARTRTTHAPPVSAPKAPLRPHGCPAASKFRGLGRTSCYEVKIASAVDLTPTHAPSIPSDAGATRRPQSPAAAAAPAQTPRHPEHSKTPERAQSFSSRPQSKPRQNPPQTVRNSYWVEGGRVGVVDVGKARVNLTNASILDPSEAGATRRPHSAAATAAPPTPQTEKSRQLPQSVQTPPPKPSVTSIGVGGGRVGVRSKPARCSTTQTQPSSPPRDAGATRRPQSRPPAQAPQHSRELPKKPSRYHKQ